VSLLSKDKQKHRDKQKKNKRKLLSSRKSEKPNGSLNPRINLYEK